MWDLQRTGIYKNYKEITMVTMDWFNFFLLLIAALLTRYFIDIGDYGFAAYTGLLAIWYAMREALNSLKKIE